MHSSVPFAEVGKALSSGRRAEIIDVLAQGERSVDEVAAEIDPTTVNTSQHLRALARAGLVASRRDGTRIYQRQGAGAEDRLAGGGSAACGWIGEATSPPPTSVRLPGLVRGKASTMSARVKLPGASAGAGGTRSVRLRPMR